MGRGRFSCRGVEFLVFQGALPKFTSLMGYLLVPAFLEGNTNTGAGQAMGCCTAEGVAPINLLRFWL